MATKFIESGSDATQDFTFYSSTSGTVASATNQAHTGPRSVELSTTGSNVLAFARKTGVLADSGTRISFWFFFDSIGTGAGSIIFIYDSGGVNQVYNLILGTAGTLQNSPTGSTSAVGTRVLVANTWYHICVSYFVTNTTTFTWKVYINGVLDSTANAGTMTRTGTDTLELRKGTGWGANKNSWYDDIYIDDGASSSSQPNTGDIRVTSKRPNANGITNGFLTQIGVGGSGYGTGHSPQVNEQPLSTTNGWQTTLLGTTEEYTIEDAGTGDVNILGMPIIDYMGWIYADASTSVTGSIIVAGSVSNVSLTTTKTLFLAAAGSISYPGGGTDIGMISSGSVSTESLYECGVVFAYFGSSRLFQLLGVGT